MRRGESAAWARRLNAAISPPFSPGAHAGGTFHYNSAMVRGYHIIFGAYGFWLPNDPRGSWSDAVWAKHLRPFGPVQKVNTRRSVADRPHDVNLRHEAKQHLKYPAVQFTGLQARAVARGFARLIDQLQLTVHACAIMPDHVHMVVARHAMTAEQITELLKRAGTRQLNKENLNPLATYQRDNGRAPSPWVKGGWQVYLNTPAEIEQRIQYVEQNPVNAGLPLQRWWFVRRYGSDEAPRGRGG